MRLLSGGKVRFSDQDIADANNPSGPHTHGGTHLLATIAQMPCPECHPDEFAAAIEMEQA